MNKRALRVVQSGAFDDAKHLHSKIKSNAQTRVTTSDVEQMMDLTSEVAHDVLSSLALAWAGRARTTEGELVVDFNPTRKPQWRASNFHVPPSISIFFTLLYEQLLFVGLASIFIGPFFIGYSMAWSSHLAENFVGFVFGATVAFAAAGAGASVLFRGVTTVAPIAILVVTILTWERFGSQEPAWALVVCGIAFFLQLETFFRFRRRYREKISAAKEETDFELLNDREKLTTFVERRERICVGDVMLRFGWDAEKATSQIVALLRELDGDIIVDDGVVFVEFVVLKGRIEPRFVTAYQRESSPPSLWRGIGFGKLLVIFVVAIIAIATSPWNPAYEPYVANYDVTLVGDGRYIRLALGIAYLVPIVFAIYRLFSNAIDRSEFKTRRAFLEKLNLAASSSTHNRDRFQGDDVDMLAGFLPTESGKENLIEFPLFSHEVTR